MAFWTRWTPFEEDIIWVAERALAFGDRVSLEVSSFSADVVVGVLDAVFLPLPESAPLSSIQEDVPESLSFSESAPLSSAQDDIIESLASSSPLEEHRDSVCSEETSEAQGSQVAGDSSPDLAPEAVCPTSSLACSGPVSPSLFSSQDEAVSVSSPQEQRCLSGKVSAGQRPEQTYGMSDNVAGPPVYKDQPASFLKDETMPPALLVTDALLCEQGLCESREETALEAVPVQGAVRESKSDVILAHGDTEGCLFERLDWGCLYEILSHLDSPSLLASSLVCRQWLTASSMARRTMTLSACGQVAKFEHSSLKRFMRLQTLKIIGGGVYLLNDRLLREIGKRAPYLQHLEVEGSENFTDAGLATVLKGCPELRVLIIALDEGRAIQCKGLSGEAFKGLRCQLTEIRLEACSRVTNEGLKALAAACPHLEKFSLKREWRAASLAAGVEDMAKFCGDLVELTLHRCGVTDVSLRALATGCPKLVVLRLCSEGAITDAGLALLLDHLRNLSQLSLVNNSRLSMIPRSRPGAALKDLNLGWWLHLPDCKLQELSKETSLEELHLFKCPALTDATVAKILVSCPKLKRLQIKECPLVTPAILESYTKSGSRVVLRIQNCLGVPASALSDECQVLGRITIS